MQPEPPLPRPSEVSPERRRGSKPRSLRMLQWTTIAVAGGYTAQSIGDNLPLAIVSNSWTCVFALFSLWAFERKRNYELAARALLCSIWFGIALSALSDGMSESKGLYLIPILPCVAAYLLGERAGVKSVGISAATIVAIIGADFLFELPRAGVLFDDLDWISFRCVGVLLFALLANLQASVARQNLQREAYHRLELDRANDTAQRASQAKSAFLARVSHEVRTPMHGILGMTQQLREGELDEGDRDCVLAIERCTDSLQGLLNDGLELSVVEGGKVAVERRGFALGPVIQDIVMLFSAKAELSETKLVYKAPPRALFALGDPKRTRQVLSNLLGNAIKFGAGTRVDVSVSQGVNAQGQAFLDVAIADQGSGISKADQAQLFQPYEQARDEQGDRLGATAKGTGLGLKISQDLAHQMNGEILVQSQLGQGSVFTLRLVAYCAGDVESTKSQNQAQRSAERPKLARFEGQEVLVVDDNGVNRRVARLMLESWGCEVQEARDGTVALQKALEQRYALILMDLQMPLMGGIEATQRIRQEGLNQDTPVVALSANAFAQDKERCLAAGMNEHVAKPCKSEQLHAVCQRYLSQDKPLRRAA